MRQAQRLRKLFEFVGDWLGIHLEVIISLNSILITDRLPLMGKIRNNSMFNYLLVLCISVMLLLSQAEGFHMHLEHDDHSMSSEPALNVHVVGVHPQSTVHDFDLTNHHDKNQSDHSAAAIDVSTDKLAKKISSLDPLGIVLLFAILFLVSPRLRRLCRHRSGRISFISCYYLLQPPLRAPPFLK